MSDRIAEAPAMVGIVMRYGFPIAFSWPDFGSGTRVFVGDTSELCGAGGIELIPFQDVNLPDGRVASIAQGLQPTTVWGFTEFDCDLFATETPLASGISLMTYTDNDVFQTGSHNSNAWGIMAQGDLSRADGGTARLNALARLANGNFTLQIILK